MSGSRDAARGQPGTRRGSRAGQQTKRLLLYTGTTGFRHTDAINGGRPVVQTALETAGYTVDWEDCTNNGGGASNCDNANKNPRIFTDDNLARYDAIVLLNASAGPPGPLWTRRAKAAIIKYVQNGGGIAGVHNATDMGTTADDLGLVGRQQRQLGRRLHDARPRRDRPQQHRPGAGRGQQPPRDRDLPDTYGFGDEHYNFNRNVRGDHHVLATLDERTYTPGGNAMGQDHPVTWCKLYDGDNINDNTGDAQDVHRRPHLGRRRWATSAPRTRRTAATTTSSSRSSAASAGSPARASKSDCSGTVWSSFTRTVVVPDANNPIGIDVAKDGKVYWSEIGNPISLDLDGLHQDVRPGRAGRQQDHGRHDPDPRGPRQLRGRRARHEPAAGLRPHRSEQAQRLRLLLAAQRRRLADHGQRPGRRLQPDQPLHAERRRHRGGAGLRARDPRGPQGQDLRQPAGFTGGPTNTGPGHVGGAGLDFDSAGNLYLGVGDDVSPNASGHSGYTPMDYRAAERWDARKTSANTADLRGKIVRITPKQGDIPAGTRPGVDATYAIPAGNMFAGRHRRRPVRRSTRWASASRSPSTPTPRTRASSAWASTATTTRQRGQPLAGGHLRVEPDQQGRQLRLAVLRR